MVVVAHTTGPAGGITAQAAQLPVPFPQALYEGSLEALGAAGAADTDPGAVRVALSAVRGVLTTWIEACSGCVHPYAGIHLDQLVCSCQ